MPFNLAEEIGLSLSQEQADKMLIETHIEDEVLLASCTSKASGMVLKQLIDNPVYHRHLVKLGPYFRLSIAGRTDTNPDLLRELSNGLGVDGLEILVTNPNCPIDVMERYSDDKYLAKYLAKNRMLPVHLFQKLAKHPDANVKLHLIINPSCPVEILRYVVLYDPNSELVRVANSKLNPMPARKPSQYWGNRTQF